MEKSSITSFFTAGATSFLGLLTGLATLAPSLLRTGEALTVRPNSSLVDSLPCQVLRTGAGVSGSCRTVLAGLPERGRVPYIELACLCLSPPPPDRFFTPDVLLIVESSIASRLPPVLWAACCVLYVPVFARCRLLGTSFDSPVQYWLPCLAPLSAGSCHDWLNVCCSNPPPYPRLSLSYPFMSPSYPPLRYPLYALESLRYPLTSDPPYGGPSSE